VNAYEVVALLEEIDLMWPGQPAPNDDERQTRLWHDWLGRYDYDKARVALRRFGGSQARPPSAAQLLGELRKMTGEQLPAADEVLAEFARVNRLHSSMEPVKADWWSRPEVAAFAMSGAYADWGLSPDASANEYLAASQSAAQASLRRRWDAFAGDAERLGLEAAYARVRIAPAPRPAGELEPVSAALEAS
jgi:hypothetical protein